MASRGWRGITPAKAIFLAIVLALITGTMALGSVGPLHANGCDFTVSAVAGTPIQDAIDVAVRVAGANAVAGRTALEA